MTSSEDLARSLRLEFDQSFAAAPLLEREQVERFLSIRVAGDPFVVRMREIAGIAVDRKVVPIPTPLATMLGVIGNRGALVPVYDLGALLGYERRPASKWLVLCAAAGNGELVALSCEEVAGYLEIAGTPADLIQTPEGLRKIIDLPAVMALITKATERRE